MLPQAADPKAILTWIHVATPSPLVFKPGPRASDVFACWCQQRSLSVCLSLSLSLCLSVCLSVCLSLSLSAAPTLPPSLKALHHVQPRCCLVISLTLLAPLLGAWHAVTTHHALLELVARRTPPDYEWLTAMLLPRHKPGQLAALFIVVSTTMNVMWQVEGTLLNSRCRVFLLFPGPSSKLFAFY